MSREEGAVRRTSRVNAGIPPSKYSPHESVASKKSDKTHSSITSRLKELELKKLEAENQLQTELEEKQLKLKLEQLERETKRKLAIIEIQASLEAEKSVESIESNSFRSNNLRSSEIKFTKASDIIAESHQPVREKVTSWLLKNDSPFLDQSYNTVPIEEYAEVHPDTSQVMQEFTNAMTHALKLITNQSRNDSPKVTLRNILGKELPTFTGSVEDWPMFVFLYRRSAETCAFSDEENLIRLQKASKHEALDAVKSLFVSPENLDDILKTLERRFGRPEFIIESMMNKVKLLPPVNTRYPISLIKFANSVLNLTVTAKSLKIEAYINNPQLLSQLVQKLPKHLQFQWARIVVRKQEDLPTPTLKEFSEWLQEESSAACLLCKPSTSNPQPINQYVDRKPKATVFVVSEDPSTRKICRFCSESSHAVFKCKHFLDLDVDKKWNWVKEQKLCFSCLNSSHRTFNCRNRRRCGVQNCEKFHNRLLHPTDVHGQEIFPQHSLQIQEVPSNVITDEKQEEIENRACFINDHSLQIQSEYKTVLLRIIPVTVIGTKTSKRTFALFDEGSTVTLLDANLAEEVGVEGINDPLKMYWMNSTSYTDNESRKFNLKIQGNLNQDIFDLRQVRTVSNLKLPVQSVDVKRLATKWKYLSQIPLVDLREAKPSILIGQDNIDLTIAREIIQGPANAPIISKTKLGWVVHGNASHFKDRVDAHYSMTCFTRSGEQEDEELKELINKTILMDNLRVENEKKKFFSEEDKKALQIMEKTCRQLENNNWKIGLLWKTENVILPDIKSTALNRFLLIEKKMQRDSQFAQKYAEKIESFVDKGYARLLTSEEAAATTHRTWYLPHFAVKHSSKPHKFRFVFDARAKVNGTNLNENLLKGPDLLNSLINVLFNFRRNKIAVMGDIEDMKLFTPDELTVEEFEKAEFELIRHSQRDCFLEEIEKIHLQKNRSKRGRLSNFNLILDQNNILRLSGRLDGAQHLNINMRQPIILDSKHWMTILLIRYYHRLNHHQGREQVINHLRERFWIINARTAVKSCISSCMICRRKNARLETQQMGQIPNFRITPQVRAFMITGMDYFGPMTVTIGRRKEKRYGVIFTCMSTRAIHLELASSLTTDSAIMSIRRFACRRGSPAEIHSDNGTNLCGAEKELKSSLQELDSSQIQQFCCVRHITWFKNPPAASHMGGVWERMIRTVKNALKTILTQQSPKEEMLQTLLVEIEYTVNSHPLMYVSSDHHDDEALTPNHFLIGKANEVTPPCVSTDIDFHLRKQWRIAQRFADLFWKRWLREYVPTLVRRSKWQFNNCDVSEGDIVIVGDDSFPRNMWPRGMVIRTFPGKDNKVRVVEVKTVTGVYRRPITKIILLKPK